MSQEAIGLVKPGAPAHIGKPPRNPGLRALIAGKTAWAEPLDQTAKANGFLGWHARGYLPHRDIPGVTQFVTFRLHDAMPASRRLEWAALLEVEDDRERRKRLDVYLDQGFGECWLRRPSVARLLIEALRHFNGRRYHLDSWVVMPNHVHLLGEVWQTPLAKLVLSWKAHVARQANALLSRKGQFWEREYWDTWIRDERHLTQARRYIENNPAKAKLVLDPAAWPWSSAGTRRMAGESA